MLAFPLQELGNTQKIHGAIRAKIASLSPNLWKIISVYYIEKKHDNIWILV